jgi:hypothetical protein
MLHLTVNNTLPTLPGTARSTGIYSKAILTIKTPELA